MIYTDHIYISVHICMKKINSFLKNKYINNRLNFTNFDSMKFLRKT